MKRNIVINKVNTKLLDLRELKRYQLFQMLRAAVHNRAMIEVILNELAERAEHDLPLQNILHKIIPPPPLDNMEYVPPHTKYGTYTKGCWRNT